MIYVLMFEWILATGTIVQPVASFSDGAECWRYARQIGGYCVAR